MVSTSSSNGRDGPSVTLYNCDQLLPNVVDDLATTKPHALYAHIPNSYTDYSAGYREVTYRQLANAVNGVAWILSKQLGRSESIDTVAYFGPNDISYPTITLGAAKAGYAMLSPSPQLTAANHITLLRATACKTILTLSAPYPPSLQAVLDSDNYTVVHIPTIYNLLDEPQEHFPYAKTYASSKDEPLVIVHTSGSTGNPRPLIYTHAAASSVVRQAQEQPPNGYENNIPAAPSIRVFTAFPFFHSAAIIASLLNGIPRQTTLVTPLAGVPPSAGSIVEALKHIEADSMVCPTPFIDQICKNPAWFDVVSKKAQFLGYGGADLSLASGRAFASAGVRVVSLYGTTEMMTIPTIRPSSPPSRAFLTSADEKLGVDDWHYIRPHSSANVAFEAQTPDGDLFEMIIRRNESNLQPVFFVCPHLEEYRTRDLFSPHPTKQGMWAFRGRADDMIVSVTGEMTNPVRFQQQVEELPEVAAALLIGEGRWKKVLLVEPAAAAATAGSSGQDGKGIAFEEFLERIWPGVERANQGLSLSSRVRKDHVIVTYPDKPMPRTGKGTVLRGATLDIYREEVDEIYRVNGDGMDVNEEPILVHVAMADER